MFGLALMRSAFAMSFVFGMAKTRFVSMSFVIWLFATVEGLHFGYSRVSLI